MNSSGADADEGRPGVEEDRQPALLAVVVDGSAPPVARIEAGVHRPHLDPDQPQILDPVPQLVHVARLRRIAGGEAVELLRRLGDEVGDELIRHPEAGQPRLHAEDDDLLERLVVFQKRVDLDRHVERKPARDIRLPHRLRRQMQRLIPRMRVNVLHCTLLSAGEDRQRRKAGKLPTLTKAYQISARHDSTQPVRHRRSVVAIEPVALSLCDR